METIYSVKGSNSLDCVRNVLTKLLESGEIKGLLVNLRPIPDGPVMPSLVSDPAQIHNADPLGPCFPLNAARLVSRMTRSPLDRKTGVVLRPCEVRALIELVKIRQASLDNLVIISFDCPGAFSNDDFRALAQDKGQNFTLDFVSKRIQSGFSDDPDMPVTTACRICADPFPSAADITFELLGQEKESAGVRAATENGKAIMSALGLKMIQGEISQERIDTISRIAGDRKSRRLAVSTQVHEATNTLERLGSYLSACVNCYNCRVACPVCFCRECVFNTDIFDYEPFQYSAWSSARGSLRMPMDTVFFHLTRMIHMGLSCIGCGQCANACPNDIPIAELFITTGEAAQAGFGYQPGINILDAPPLSEFKDSEFQDITGL